MTRLPRLVLTLFFALAALALGASTASATVGEPLTSGPNYDRNPTVVEDRHATYLFFVRSQIACNRLQGCSPDNGPGAVYDLWYRKSYDGGDHYGPARLAAENPAPATGFRGRTIAAVYDGSRVQVFWADGGFERELYRVEKAAGSDEFSPGIPVAGSETTVFNVEAIHRDRDQTYLYTEGTGPAGYGVYAQPYEDGVSGPATLVQLGRFIPKALVDKRKRTVRVTYTDGGRVYVNSSADGLNFASEQVVAEAEGDDTNWDPNLAQTRNGRYVLSFAPDRGDGRQQLAVSFSRDFDDWSDPVSITPAEQDGTPYWDYWPEGFAPGSALYYTSERGFAGNPVGTGHIWRIGGDDDDRGHHRGWKWDD